MTKAKVHNRSLPVKKNTQEERICFTEMSIKLPSPTLTVFYLIYQCIKNVKVYADNALKAFTLKRPLTNMSVFAPAKTLCRCCTCFRLKTLNRPTYNSDNSVTHTRLRLSYMQTLSRFSSQFSGKTKSLVTTSITKSERRARS